MSREYAAKDGYLNVMFGKLFCKRSPSMGKGIDSIVYCYLAIFVVQEVIYVISASLDDFLSQ